MFSTTILGCYVRIRFGYELVYSVRETTPMVFMLRAQPNRNQRLVLSDVMRTTPAIPVSFFSDAFRNTGVRLEAPPGILRITANGIMEDDGVPEPEHWELGEHPVSDLPPETLPYLLASRYCETDLLMGEAWRLFAGETPGWSRVQAICDFVNQEVTFGYAYARPTKSALETYRERQGVCRDLAHLSIAFCRCLNIPARYCTSYLGDIGVPPVDAPMDFAACMEVYLGGEWHMFDPRNNTRRIGRIVIARGRDAADVAISTAFGAPSLQEFHVWTDELIDHCNQKPDLPATSEVRAA